MPFIKTTTTTITIAKFRCHITKLEGLDFIYSVKFSRYRPGVAQRVGTGTALLFHDRGARRG